MTFFLVIGERTDEDDNDDCDDDCDSFDPFQGWNFTSFRTVGVCFNMRWTCGGSLVDTKCKRDNSGNSKEDLYISAVQCDSEG